MGAAPSGGQRSLAERAVHRAEIRRDNLLAALGADQRADVVSGGLKHMTYLLLVLRESINAFVSAHIIKTMGRVAQRTKVGDA